MVKKRIPLKIFVKKKYNCELKDVLNDLAKDGKTYQEAAKELGYYASTVNKYRKAYNINFKVKYKPYQKDILQFLRSEDLNKINIMSRRW